MESKLYDTKGILHVKIDVTRGLKDINFEQMAQMTRLAKISTETYEQNCNHIFVTVIMHKKKLSLLGE